MEDNSRLLYAAAYALCHEASGHVSGAKVNELMLLVNRFAIYSATAGVAGAIPAVGSVVASLSQTALVWTMYIQINKIFDLDFSDSKIKFIGSAIMTNLSVNAGALLLSIAAAAVVSLVPIFGNAASIAICGSIGYIMMYSAAILYLLYLNKVFKAKGVIEISGDKKDEEIIKGILKDTDLNKIIQEAKNNYKKDKQKGAFDASRSSAKCPVCGAQLDESQRFCTNCGFKHK